MQLTLGRVETLLFLCYNVIIDIIIMDQITPRFYRQRQKLDQMEMVCPAQHFTPREIFAMYHYMEYAFQDDIEKFFEGFSVEDDAWWDEQASRSAHQKLLEMTNYCYEEGFVKVDGD